MTSPDVADDQFVLRDGVSGEMDDGFGGSVEKGEIGDGGAAQDFVEEGQMVVTARHGGDGGRAGHAHHRLDLGYQLGFDVRVMEQPSDDPVQERARCVRAWM